MALDAETVVRTLLDTANLTVSDEEFDRFAHSYPVLRYVADGLYLPELEAEEPAVSFDPAAE
jgi:hypothetical protein